MVLVAATGTLGQWAKCGGFHLEHKELQVIATEHSSLEAKCLHDLSGSASGLQPSLL
jgi:hypothetical protein